MTATSLEELGSMLQRFGVVDYIVFTLMLLICAVIGVYYGFFSKQVTADDYLVGGRKMKIFPISMSLIASFISGITLLGTPTEMYLYGTQYLYISFGVVLMGLAMTYAYLPVLHDLQLTSTYEYLELRFNKQARLFGSVLFAISVSTQSSPASSHGRLEFPTGQKDAEEIFYAMPSAKDFWSND